MVWGLDLWFNNGQDINALSILWIWIMHLIFTLDSKYLNLDFKDINT
jgi:hypothetical protein